MLLLSLIVVSPSYAQHKTQNRLLQVYWDDDYINFYGHGTDKAYTSGIKFSLFYNRKHPSKSFINKILPKAGDSTNNINGFTLSQVIFTPNDITDPNFQPNDYPWSGALYLTHSHHSYNEKKQFNLQTELDFGVIGPASMVEQTQKMAHKLVHYNQPKGWDNQHNNKLLLNLNFTAEKLLFNQRKFLEVIGGGQGMIGSKTNAASIYCLVRIGKMNPYFQGLIKQYSPSAGSAKTQFYFVFKSKFQGVISNSILQVRPSNPNEHYQSIENFLASYSFGVVLVLNRFSVSSIQTTSTTWLKNLYDHTWGNFTFTYSL